MVLKKIKDTEANFIPQNIFQKPSYFSLFLPRCVVQAEIPHICFVQFRSLIQFLFTAEPKPGETCHYCILTLKLGALLSSMTSECKGSWERSCSLTSFTSDLNLWFHSVLSLNSVNSCASPLKLLLLYVTEAKNK